MTIEVVEKEREGQEGGLNGQEGDGADGNTEQHGLRVVQ